MKVDRVEHSSFVPIAIKIVFQSKDELNELWHRLNLPLSVLEDHCEECFLLPRHSTTNSLFYFIDDVLKS